jgi:hypothetical protein
MDGKAKSKDWLMPIKLRLSVEELPENWRSVLKWGPCFCRALVRAKCPSCTNSQRIEIAGLDWETEYEKAIDAGDAIRL